MNYWVYILESETSRRLYIGQTQNLENRLEKHNNGYVRSTKGRGPWKVYFSTALPSRSAAFILEKKLKNLRSRLRLDNYLQKHFPE